MSSENCSFGNRHLKDDKDVFAHNAWDDVEWTEHLKEVAECKVKCNSTEILSASEQEKYEAEANLYWDKFYGIHKNRFFKDRHWLFVEFPQLCTKTTVSSNGEVSECKTAQSTGSDKELSHIEERPVVVTNEMLKILEVGCGVGNSVFPILEANVESNVFVYCCDFSETAISLVKSHPSYDSTKCLPFVYDITDDTKPMPFPTNSLDIILLVFVLSSIHPEKMQSVVNNLVKYLKPGGCIFFRDYGRYDMVQLRFKSGQCLANHFYVRGDGTRVYFYTDEEVHDLFTNAGLIKKQNAVNRRLQVNRGKLLKMYRIWVQAIYMKPEPVKS